MQPLIDNLKSGMSWHDDMVTQAEQRILDHANALRDAQAQLLRLRTEKAEQLKAIAILEAALAKEEAEKNG